MLPVLAVPEFGWRLDSHAGRPSTTKGVSVTPGNNTKGSYVQITSALSFDAWAIEIFFHTNAVTNEIRDCLADIGFDPAGGSSYTAAINNLLVGLGNNFTGGGTLGCSPYYFPLFIPTGTSVGVRASVNNAGVAAFRCFAVFYGKPERPEEVRAGSIVQTLGANTAASNGTSITAGTTSEGSWTSLGTLTRQSWWWQIGVGVGDASMTTMTYGVDIGAGAASGAEKPLITEAYYMTTSSETAQLFTPRFPYREAAAGLNVYGRMQASTTADAALSMIAYAVA